MNQQVAKLNNLRIAPRKVRLVVNTLKGLSTQEAEAQLLFRTQRSAKELLKLLRSAVANAKNRKFNPDQLFIKNIIVNQGPMLKRFMPRAMGRAAAIQKKTSHITLVLEEGKNKLTKRFSIIPPVKKEKKIKKPTPEKPKAKEEKESVKKPEKTGFFKRLFRRKSV